MNSLFHLAYHVHNLEVARQFYGGLLGCQEGRSTATWGDLNVFGHQISLHLGESIKLEDTGIVSEHRVTMPHLGLILDKSVWQALPKKLVESGTRFVIAPILRSAGQPGEQGAMFFRDPPDNPIGIKGFADFVGVYAA